MPNDGKILYVGAGNQFIQAAKKIAEDSGCVKQSTGAVIVIENEIVATGSNAGLRVEICPRITEKCATGTGYHHCQETCKQEGHAEKVASKAFLNQLINQSTPHQSLRSDAGQANQLSPSLYLWGHWWCCEPCWDAMREAGINTVYLIENATELFDLDASKQKE